MLDYMDCIFTYLYGYPTNQFLRVTTSKKEKDGKEREDLIDLTNHEEFVDSAKDNKLFDYPPPAEKIY